MKLIVILATALCVTLVGSSPLSDRGRLQSEALNRLVMAEADNEAALRNKRTIGILRELFPDASQMIEKKVNSIVAEIIRILGPTVLRSLIQNNGDSNSGSSSSGGSTATAEPPFFDDEEDDAGNSKNINPEAEYKVNEVAAESQNNEVKVQFADEQGSNDAAPPLTPLEEVETEDDENRNKRFLSGLGGSSSSSGNFVFDIIRQAADGAARAAGTVYRVVAGTQSLGLGLSASRDLGPIPQGAAPAAAPAGSSTTAGSSTSAPAASGAGNLPPLVAGSGGDGSAGKAGEEPQEAIPGPVTRFFVIVNRGISNLVQDLILRLAATSERIVNFKARLITSVI